MDSDSIPLWLAFIFFILAGAYFAGSESSFSAVNKIRVKAKADEGSKPAKRVMYVLNHFEKALTTLLVGNNITHIAAASVATVLATHWYEGRGGNADEFVFVLLCTVISTAVVFLFSEMIPKSLANDRAETLSLATGGILRFFMRIFTPLSAFFGLISRGVTRLFGGKEAPSITEDELMEIIDTAEEEGVVDEEQGDILKSALEFHDTYVRDVMTMAKDIESLDVTAKPSDVLAAVLATNHSRIPVFSAAHDRVIGILRIRNFLMAYRKNSQVQLRTLLNPVYYVREDAKVDEVLSEMRQHMHHMAVVVDEQKQVVGIVTIEDFLEELVGEIFDEEDVVDQNFQPLGGNRYLINTHMLVGSAYERMGLPAAPRAIAAKPLIVFLLGQLGHVPAEGDACEYGQIEYTVESVEDGNATYVVAHILDENDLAERRLAAEGEVKA